MGFAHRSVSNSIYNFDICNISCPSGVSGVMAFHKRHAISQVKATHEVDLALVEVNGTIVGKAVG